MKTSFPTRLLFCLGSLSFVACGSSAPPGVDGGTDAAMSPTDASRCMATTGGDTRIAGLTGTTFSPRRTVLAGGAGSLEWSLGNGSEAMELAVLSTNGCDADVRVTIHHRSATSDDWDTSPDVHGPVHCTRVDAHTGPSFVDDPVIGFACDALPLIDPSYTSITVTLAVGGDPNTAGMLAAEVSVDYTAVDSSVGSAHFDLFDEGR